MYDRDKEALEIESSKKFLEDRGFTVLRTKSYKASQERLRVADARRRAAEESRADTERWVREKLIPEERRLHQRLTYVYGQARAAGASVEDLLGPGGFARGGFVSGPGTTVRLRKAPDCLNGHRILELDGVPQHIISRKDLDRADEILECERMNGPSLEGAPDV